MLQNSNKIHNKINTSLQHYTYPELIFLLAEPGAVWLVGWLRLVSILLFVFVDFVAVDCLEHFFFKKSFFTDNFLFLLSLPSECFLSLLLYWFGAKMILLILFQEWIGRAALPWQAKPDLQSLLATFSCISTF